MRSLAAVLLVILGAGLGGAGVMLALVAALDVDWYAVQLGGLIAGIAVLVLNAADALAKGQPQ